MYLSGRGRRHSGAGGGALCLSLDPQTRRAQVEYNDSSPGVRRYIGERLGEAIKLGRSLNHVVRRRPLEACHRHYGAADCT